MENKSIGNNRYWIWFSRLESLGSIKMQKLLKDYKNPEVIYNLKKEDLEKNEYLSIDNIRKILDGGLRYGLDRLEEYMIVNKIELIHIKSKDYPKKLKQIYDRPVVLYVRGDKKILNDFSLAIIGCRENTLYGEMVGRKISSEIAKKNIITVSGLARGIDSICHRTSLEQKGKTIAVIGSGHDNIYPRRKQ